MIILLGISHHSAPIELRERIALDREQAGELSEVLARAPEIGEAFVVSTCNRVEIVATVKRPEDAELGRSRCLEALCQADIRLAEHAYFHTDADALRHLLRVAASLDSLVVGEPQILGQLKQGFETARARGTVGAELGDAFTRAVRGARRVRNETGIGAGQISVPSIAVQLAQQVFGDLSGHTVALVGSGEMGQAVARLLQDSGAGLLVLGRDLDKVKAVTGSIGGTALTMTELGQVLSQAHVLVSSTSAPGFVVSRSLVDAVRRARRGRPLLVIDLAVPRDVEPSVGDVDGVFLYNIDDLSSVAAESRQARGREAERAERLVDELVGVWQKTASSRQATPAIKALRSRMHSVLRTELDKSLRGRLRSLGEEERAALAVMHEAAINRLLHRATVRLRELASGDGEAIEEVTQLLGDLFDLEATSSPEATSNPAAASNPEAALEELPSRPALPAPTESVPGSHPRATDVLSADSRAPLATPRASGTLGPHAEGHRRHTPE